MALSPLFHKIAYDDLPGWRDDDGACAFDAFLRCASRFGEKPYKTGALGVEAAAFAPAYAEALQSAVAKPQAARAFFERHFVPHRIVPDHGATGFVTGFYEPEVDASPVKTARFQVPLLARPADLVDLDDDNRPQGMDGGLAFGRQTPHGIVEYHDRAAIERGALSGKDLEIAWLADPVDAFFIHVQGAARLRMANGDVQRITYAAKSGHPFSGPGRILADLGEIPPTEVTMQTIRRWLHEHADRMDAILHQNRSYIFFREAPVDDPELGPIAAAKVPLTGGRSIAVDRKLHTFGTPIFIDAPALTAFGGNGFRRLMIAQDTGSAITGPARGDLFTGSGQAAGEIAGVIRHPAHFYALVPNSLVGREA